jgi:hypothetical protein
VANIDLASDALVYARGKLKKFKSDNKWDQPALMGKALQDKKAEDRYFRANWAQSRICKLKTIDVQEKGMPALLDYGVLAEEQEAGYCLEYTAVACLYLSQLKPVPVFDAVSLADPGDHVFVAIGQPCAPDGTYPMSFAAWQADAAICDGWAKLACLARDFPDQWKAKMNSWAEKPDKKPSLPGRGRFSPTHNVWFDALDECGKLSFTRVEPKAKKGCCYITTATCQALGLPDDCAELTTLRWFRDAVLLPTPEGARAVARYYRLAPAVVSGINRLPDATAVYRELYRRWVRPAADAVRDGRFALARELFEEMVGRTQDGEGD